MIEAILTNHSLRVKYRQRRDVLLERGWKLSSMRWIYPLPTRTHLITVREDTEGQYSEKVPDSGTFCGVGGDNGFDKKRVFITSVMNTRSGCRGDFYQIRRRVLPVFVRKRGLV